MIASDQDTGESMSQDPDGAERNSPLVLVAVMLIVVVGALSIALVGRAATRGLTTVVTGAPLAVGEPAPAAPRRVPASVADIGDNPLITAKATVPEVTCELPELNTAPGGLEAYYRAGIGCLERLWQPVLTTSALPFSRPGLNLDDRPRARCGFAPTEEEATAFYCARDRTIYMPQTRLARDAGDISAYHLAVLAHEYGHHVQALSGTLDDGAKVSPGTPAGDAELSRRTELQANCLAGVFFAAVGGRGSVDDELARASVRSFADTTGAETHGSSDSQARWAQAGFDARSPSACDTWTAASADVR